MEVFLLNNVDWALRLVVFASVLYLMMRWEKRAPRRPLTVDKTLRWGSNLLLVFINSLLLRVVLSVGAVGVAALLQGRRVGLFSSQAVPSWVSVPASIVLLDFALYLQHLFFHAVPVLWRVHMVHHGDRDIDTSTGLRFHTIEIMLSMGIKLLVIVLFGVPAVAVMVFECLLLASSLYNHGNVRLSPRTDRILRYLIVTPDMHRVHHSIEENETDSNFGFCLSWWDRLLGTYRGQPALGHEGMTIGLKQLRDERAEQLPWMLLWPFNGTEGNYPFNRPAESPAPPVAETSEKAVWSHWLRWFRRAPRPAAESNGAPAGPATGTESRVREKAANGESPVSATMPPAPMREVVVKKEVPVGAACETSDGEALRPTATHESEGDAAGN